MSTPFRTIPAITLLLAASLPVSSVFAASTPVSVLPDANLQQGLTEATMSDDPLAGSVVKRLLDQYGAALADREKLANATQRAQEGAARASLQARSLEQHLATLREEILSSEIAIRSAEVQHETLVATIAQHQRELVRLRAEEARQTDVVRTLLRALQERASRSEIELLLESQSFAHAVDAAASLDEVKAASVASIEKLTKIQQARTREENQLREDSNTLYDLQAALDEQRTYLVEQRKMHTTLLLRTRGQQQLYEQLLAEAQAQQAEVDRELQGVVDALATIADPAALQKLGDSNLASLGAVSAKGLIWPVPPLKVTTFFHDPEYRRYFPFEHEGVDLRAAQSTEVHAVADAVVLAAKDRGNGYSFVVLLHRDHLSTVYGHMSEIRVQEGQVIRQGDVIGLSGGEIGSHGAGPYTTGPHLHFEVRVAGVPTNPLDYLP